MECNKEFMETTGFNVVVYSQEIQVGSQGKQIKRQQ